LYQLIGCVAEALFYAACSVLKPKLGYDDALDTFGVHGVGGTIGALATALLMDASVNPAGGALAGKGLLSGQLAAMAACVILSCSLTWLIAKFVAKTVGLRPTEEEESQGVGIVDHGEEGYSNN